MTIAEMLEQSGVLTLMGMGTVLLFLAILIVCVILLGKIVHALGGDKDGTAKPSATSAPRAANGQGAPGAPVIAAITAAVKDYQANH
jgi:oxaloacetate decarboxylase gamma subunit